MLPVVSCAVFVLTTAAPISCTPSDIVDIGGDHPWGINIRRAWSARTATSIRPPDLWPTSLETGNLINSNVLRFRDSILFTEVQMRPPDADPNDLNAVWVTRRELSTGKLLYRRPFDPGCTSHLDRRYHLVAMGDHVFIGYSAVHKPAHKLQVGVCWNVKKGEKIGGTSLTREQLPEGVDLSFTENRRPFASNGKSLFVCDMNGADMHLVAVEPPAWKTRWHQKLRVDLRKGDGYGWSGVRVTENRAIGALALTDRAYHENCRGGVFVTVVDTSSGRILWKKQTGMSPVWSSWHECDPIALGPNRIYLPTDRDAVEAWEISSGRRVWRCPLGGQIASPIAIGDGRLGLVITDRFEHEVVREYGQLFRTPKDFRPSIVVIDCRTGSVLRTFTTNLRLRPRDVNRLAHLPGWFLLSYRCSLHAFPTDPDAPAREWTCWLGVAFGFIPYAPNWHYQFDQPDSRHVVVWAPSIQMPKMTLFTSLDR